MWDIQCSVIALSGFELIRLRWRRNFTKTNYERSSVSFMKQSRSSQKLTSETKDGGSRVYVVRLLWVWSSSKNMIAFLVRVQCGLLLLPPLVRFGRHLSASRPLSMNKFYKEKNRAYKCPHLGGLHNSSSSWFVWNDSSKSQLIGLCSIALCTPSAERPSWIFNENAGCIFYIGLG